MRAQGLLCLLTLSTTPALPRTHPLACIPYPSQPAALLPSPTSTACPESNEEKGKTDVRAIKTDLAQAKQLIQDMEMSNRTIAEPTKRDVAKKISVHRETMKTLEKDLALAEQKFDRGALFGARGGAGGGGGPLEYDKSQSARDRATAATEKLKTGSSVLEDAHRRVEETIDVGADTLGQLESNREKMLRIRGNVREGGGEGRAAWICAVSAFCRRANPALPPFTPAWLTHCTSPHTHTCARAPCCQHHVRRLGRCLGCWTLRGASCGA